MTSTATAVRVLPMNRESEFPMCKSCEEVQQNFFLEDLPFRSSCDYLFHHAGLNADPGAVILFQCDGQIIASAVLLDHKHFPKPVVEDGKKYEGCLYFDAHTIKVFDPVGQNAIRKIWPEIKQLSQVKWSVKSPERFPVFERGLKHVRTPRFS